MKFQIVTVADRERPEKYYHFREFLESCRRFGHEPLILGWGVPFMGLGTKPRLFWKAIMDGTVKAENVVFCDAYDILFSEDPESLSGRHGGKVMFNAEKSCFPDASLAELHPPSTSPWRYLNSGLSVGPLWAYLECLNAMNASALPDDMVGRPGLPNVHYNDQDYWMRLLVSGKLPIGLDSGCEMFQTLHGTIESELDISGDRISNLVTGSFPIGFHANGDKTSNLVVSIYRKLGF